VGCGGAERETVAVGAPAPTYAAETVEGTPIALADLKGKVVLLNIWATWCKPCREEIPALETLFQRHRAAGLEVIGVSIDAPSEAARLRPFVTELGASYLIDRDGVLRWRHMGPVRADDPALTAALRTVLTSAP